MLFNLIPMMINSVSATACGPCGWGAPAATALQFPFLSLGSAPGELAYRFNAAANLTVPAVVAGIATSSSVAQADAYLRQQLGIACPGVLLPPIGVTSTNYLKNGALISRYRKCVSKFCGDWEWCLKAPFVICTKRSPCRLLTEAQFTASVISTIRTISGERSVRITDKTYQVIRSIYAAAIESGATVDQLISFTSTALHNVFLFTRFPVPNPRDNAIGVTTRGLLQLLSLNAYEKITSISAINYVQTPNALDLFNPITINDEFRTFLRFYNNDNLSGIESFIQSVHRLESREAPLVNNRSAIAVLNGTYVPRNILEERVLQRFNIFYTLSARIFVFDNAAGADLVVAYEK